MKVSSSSVVLITTFQPLMLLWIIAIAFFFGLAVASAISRGRTWQQSLSTWLWVWIISSIVGVVVSNFFGMNSVLLEWIM